MMLLPLLVYSDNNCKTCQLGCILHLYIDTFIFLCNNLSNFAKNTMPVTRIHNFTFPVDPNIARLFTSMTVMWDAQRNQVMRIQSLHSQWTFGNNVLGVANTRINTRVGAGGTVAEVVWTADLQFRGGWALRGASVTHTFWT